MKRLIIFGVIVLIGIAAPVKADLANPVSYGAAAQLEMDFTIELSNGLEMTFKAGHGWNSAGAYVYTDVGGTIEEYGHYPGGPDTSSQIAAASTTYGAANGSVTVNTAGFDYDIDADALVQSLDIGDYGYAKGYADAWADWLQVTSPGTATITVDYTYTLDTRNTPDVASSWVYMDVFFADHAGTNYLTAQGDWTVGYGDNPNTTITEYIDSIGPGEYLEDISGSVSWEIDISGIEPENWWSLWAQGEVGVEAAPVPVPAAVVLGMLGLGVAGIKLRKFA